MSELQNAALEARHKLESERRQRLDSEVVYEREITQLVQTVRTARSESFSNGTTDSLLPKNSFTGRPRRRSSTLIRASSFDSNTDTNSLNQLDFGDAPETPASYRLKSQTSSGSLLSVDEGSTEKVRRKLSLGRRGSKRDSETGLVDSDEEDELDDLRRVVSRLQAELREHKEVESSLKEQVRALQYKLDSPDISDSSRKLSSGGDWKSAYNHRNGSRDRVGNKGGEKVMETATTTTAKGKESPKAALLQAAGTESGQEVGRAEILKMPPPDVPKRDAFCTCDLLATSPPSLTPASPQESNAMVQGRLLVRVGKNKHRDKQQQWGAYYCVLCGPRLNLYKNEWDMSKPFSHVDLDSISVRIVHRPRKNKNGGGGGGGASNNGKTEPQQEETDALNLEHEFHIVNGRRGVTMACARSRSDLIAWTYYLQLLCTSVRVQPRRYIAGWLWAAKQKPTKKLKKKKKRMSGNESTGKKKDKRGSVGSVFFRRKANNNVDQSSSSNNKSK